MFLIKKLETKFTRKKKKNHQYQIKKIYFLPVSVAFFGLVVESKAEVWCFTFSFKILFCLCELMLFIIVVANFPCFVVRKH